MDERNDEYPALEPAFPPARDPEVARWVASLDGLSAAEVSVREATAGPRDGRRIKDLQLVCEPIAVQSIRANGSMIADQLVLLAELNDTHVGFCVSSTGPRVTDPIFIRVVAVAPSVQRRGVGLALLAAAAEREPGRSIAMATRDDNYAARSLNEHFARSIGATIRRVRLGTYKDGDLGIQRGFGYRSWIIERPSSRVGVGRSRDQRV